jgi:hypothetical protein
MYGGVNGVQTVRNNIFHDFLDGGPDYTDDGQYNYGSGRLGAIGANSNMDVYHNTFVNVPHAFTTHGEYGAGGATVTNNLFQNTGSTVPGSYSYNAWVGNRPKQSGSNDINPGSALLNNNYSLQSASPLINKGKSGLGVNIDFIGNTRPFGSAPDIGAYEFTGGSTNPSTTPTDIPLSPSPTMAPTALKSTLSSWLTNLFDRNGDQRTNTLDWLINIL